MTKAKRYDVLRTVSFGNVRIEAGQNVAASKLKDVKWLLSVGAIRLVDAGEKE